MLMTNPLFNFNEAQKPSGSLGSACWQDISFKAMMLLMVIAMPFMGKAQFNQNVAGDPNFNDLWETYPTSTGYVSIGNAQRPGSTGTAFMNGIWFSPYNPNVTLQAGQMLITDPAGLSVYATDFSPMNGSAGYYLTGERQNVSAAIPKLMFVAQTNAAGNVTWAQQIAMPANTESWGVSTVTMPNNDVVVIGNIKDLATNNIMVIAARFNMAGAMIWSNVYNSGMTPTPAPFELEAFEATYDASINTAATIGGILVTGRHIQSGTVIGTNRTFVMSIDGAGNELWRNNYPSTGVEDQGFDIVQGLNFVIAIVGHSKTASGASRLYIVQIAAGGAAMWQHVYNNIAGTVGNEHGRAIDLSHTSGRYVVAGFRDNTGSTTTTSPDDLTMMEIDFNGTPIWHNNYDISDPAAFRASEGVRRVPGGYVLTGATTQNATDGFIAYTDITGTTPTISCPVITEAYGFTNVVNMNSLLRAQTPMAWIGLTLAANPYNPTETPCMTSTPCTVTAGFTSSISGSTVALSNTTSSAGSVSCSYQWTINGTNYSTLFTPPIATLTVGVHNICLGVTCTNAAGTVCTDTYCQTVTINNTTCPYDIGTDTTYCSTNILCVPINAVIPVNPGINGMDFTINYNPAILTPTGNVNLGPVVTGITSGSVLSYISSPGTIHFSLAGVSIAFAGTGMVMCVEFTAAPGAPLGSTPVTCSQLIETYTTAALLFPCVDPGTAVIASGGSMTGHLIYWNDPTRTLNGGGSYLTTNISGANGSCTILNPNVATTDASANFTYNISNGSNIEITRDIPNANPVMSIINGADALKTAQYRLGSFTTTNPYQVVAMDVDRNDVVTAGDATVIMQRTVGMYGGQYQLCADWLFVDSTTAVSFGWTAPNFDKNNVPNVAACYAVPTVTVNGCTSALDGTYHGILMGDVVTSTMATTIGSWTTADGTSLAHNTGEVKFDLSKTCINEQDGTVQIPVIGTYAQGVGSIDFDMDFDEQYLSLASSPIQNSLMNSIEYNVLNNRLLVSSYSLNTNNTAAPLFYVTFNVAAGLTAVTPQHLGQIQAYLNGVVSTPSVVGTASVCLGNEGVSALETSIGIAPNPANEMFNLSLNMSETATVKVQIVDALGRVVNTQSQDFGNGLHNLSFNTESYPSGLYMVLVQVGNKSFVEKLMINK